MGVFWCTGVYLGVFGCIWVYMSVYKWVYIHEYMRVYLDVYGCMDVFGCIWVGVSQPDPRGYTCLMRGAGDWKVFQFHTPHSYHPDHGHKVWPLENQSIILKHNHHNNGGMMWGGWTPLQSSGNDVAPPWLNKATTNMEPFSGGLNNFPKVDHWWAGGGGSHWTFDRPCVGRMEGGEPIATLG